MLVKEKVGKSVAVHKSGLSLDSRERSQDLKFMVLVSGSTGLSLRTRTLRTLSETGLKAALPFSTGSCQYFDFIVKIKHLALHTNTVFVVCTFVDAYFTALSIIIFEWDICFQRYI